LIIAQKKLLKYSLLAFFIIYIIIFAIRITSFTPPLSQIEYQESNNHEEIFNKKFTGTAKAIDGDSLYVDDNEVRLLYIDAPEYKQECLNSKGQSYRCGAASADFLKKLVQNKQIICKYSHKDRYNRFLAICFIGKESINELIVKNGMAVIYNLQQASKNIITLEEEAKSLKKGIWQGHFQLPQDYRRSSKS
jgi:endonuclease YncB( thermonuclease family)